MTGYNRDDSYFNEVIELEDEYYLVQDGPLLEQPLARPINDLLECERDNVQLMIGKLEQSEDDYRSE